MLGLLIYIRPCGRLYKQEISYKKNFPIFSDPFLLPGLEAISSSSPNLLDSNPVKVKCCNCSVSNKLFKKFVHEATALARPATSLLCSLLRLQLGLRPRCPSPLLFYKNSASTHVRVWLNKVSKKSCYTFKTNLFRKLQILNE